MKPPQNARFTAGGSKPFALQPAFSATKLLIDISLARILLVLLSPFRNSLAWFLKIYFVVSRGVLRTTGWLSAPPKTRALRHLAISLIDVRRWHLFAGEFGPLQATMPGLNPPNAPLSSTFRTSNSHFCTFPPI